jgi:hypothetical protein
MSNRLNTDRKYADCCGLSKINFEPSVRNMIRMVVRDSIVAGTDCQTFA